MPEYLTKRHGHWQFVRRVPLEFSDLDPRGVVKHSTKVAVDQDKRGIKAGRVADALNRGLETYWRGLAEGKAQDAAARYAEARRRARQLGYDYAEASELVTRPTEEIVKRFETLIAKGLTEDASARAALLGYEQRPTVKLSELFPKFEHQTRAEVSDMSHDQLRRWKNGYTLAVSDLISVVGDKDLAALTHADVLDYVEWLEDRVAEGELIAKTANRYIGLNSKMIKTLNRKLRLGLSDLFSGMRLKTGPAAKRPSYEAGFVQNKLLSGLAGLNDEARHVVMLIADTGLRISEAVNLNATTIRLDAEVPHIEVLPDGRRVKTQDSIRKIPLVGAALCAMQSQPRGFPRYHDKSASLSNHVNKYLAEQGLRPTRNHSVYSLRHTFKDRLIAAKCEDSMIESLMGHADDHPKYGEGPSLALKLEVLQRIAFKPPAVL